MTELAYSVIAVFGPTASGKSAVAQELATRIGTEVVSADALQVYAGLPILTNQSPAPTRLTAFRDLSEEMSVGEYAGLAHAAIDELVAAHGGAVVAGGTGLYLRAALADLAIPASVEPAQRAALELLYDDDPRAAHDRLAALDPAAADRVHVNDRRRVVRALELAESGSSLVPATDELWSTRCGTRRSSSASSSRAEELDRRIRARAEDMVARGAVAEARSATAGPISKTAAQGARARRADDAPARARRPSSSSPGHAGMPRTSGSGCAASRASPSSMRIARRRRWSMTSSTWHALGNTYVVVEPTDQRARRGRASALAQGTDGVLEVLGRTERSVEIAIWNPDGSRAELSGNGTRIAAAWLAAQTGRIRGDRRGRRTRRRAPGCALRATSSRIWERSSSEPEETIDGITFVPVSVGNPHAVVVGRPGANRRARPTARDTRRGFPSGPTSRSRGSTAPAR